MLCSRAEVVFLSAQRRSLRAHSPHIYSSASTTYQVSRKPPLALENSTNTISSATATEPSAPRPRAPSFLAGRTPQELVRSRRRPVDIGNGSCRPKGSPPRTSPSSRKHPGSLHLPVQASFPLIAASLSRFLPFSAPVLRLRAPLTNLPYFQPDFSPSDCKIK